MTVVSKRINDLHPIEKNIRLHPKSQIIEYKRSIEMFGQIRPLVIDETGEIIVGNGLYAAMAEMGYEYVECYEIKGLSLKQKTKLMMADNKIYELGHTSVDVIEDIVSNLDKDFDVPGWDSEILRILDATQKEIDELVSDVSAREFEEDEAEESYLSHEGENDMHDEAKKAGSRRVVVEQTDKYVICPRCGEKICL